MRFGSQPKSELFVRLQGIYYLEINVGMPILLHINTEYMILHPMPVIAQVNSQLVG